MSIQNAKINIRHPQRDDFQTWQITYRAYLTFYKTSLTDEQLQKVWSWIIDKKLYCLMAELNGRVIGLVHFRDFIRPVKAEQALFMDDLIVLPEFHGQGVGYQLIDAVKEYAKSNQYSIIRWITAADNQQAMKLYDAVAHKTSWVTYDLSSKID